MQASLEGLVDIDDLEICGLSAMQFTEDSCRAETTQADTAMASIEDHFMSSLWQVQAMLRVGHRSRTIAASSTSPTPILADYEQQQK